MIPLRIVPPIHDDKPVTGEMAEQAKRLGIYPFAPRRDWKQSADFRAALLGHHAVASRTPQIYPVRFWPVFWTVTGYGSLFGIIGALAYLIIGLTVRS